MGRVFDVGWQCLYKRFQVIINKFRYAFSRVTIASYNRTARVSLFMNFWKYVETTSSWIWVGSEIFVGLLIN